MRTDGESAPVGANGQSAMSPEKRSLTDRIARESQQAVEPAIVTVTDEIRSRHGLAAAAVLFYGSCLREAKRAATMGTSVLDFYLLVDSYSAVYSGRWLALANRLLPPNVFYVEVRLDGIVLRAKYAVVTISEFRRGTSLGSFHSSLWCRFSQPVRLVYARDDEVRRQVVSGLCSAVLTMVERTAPLLGERFTSAALWSRGIEESYRSELRAEGPQRAGQIYEADRERYEEVTVWALKINGISASRTPDTGEFVLTTPLGRGRRWKAWLLCVSRRQFGKLLTAARLVKAAVTFEGGLEYVLWKVERHSGVRVKATPWQCRHPLLSGPALIWRLYRRGGFR